MSLRKLFILVVFASTGVHPLSGGIPEPDALLYGLVSVDGVVLTAEDSDVIVVALVDGADSPVGSYRMGEDETVDPNYYLLRIGLETPTDGTGQIVFKGTDVSIEEPVNICVEKPDFGQICWGYVHVDGRGHVQKLDLELATRPDADGDGLSDEVEEAWGLNPGADDTDGDGLSDGFEVCYDGTCDTYDPYDPTAQAGADLNAISVDTDGDGMPDAWEVAGSLDPLGDDRHVDQDKDGYTNFTEYVRGSLPNDANSVPAPMAFYVDDDGQFDPSPGDPSVSDPVEDGTRDHPFDSIQEALNLAIDHDTVVVADGIYSGPGNRDLDFMGTSVKLIAANWASGCVVDCEQVGRAFRFQNGEDPNAVVRGFMIINGYADNGGAVYCQDSSPAFHNCIFASNIATNDGGAFFVTGTSSPEVTNCTLTRNVAGARGGAICCAPGNSMVITNTIFWDNTHETAGPGREIYLEDAMEPAQGSRVDLLYSCIPSAWDPVYVYRGNVWLIWWDSLVNSDPQFADPDRADYHLMSQAGRWDPNGPSWVADDISSLCIDAGDPDSAWVPEIWPHGKRINMGAYGGTPEASLSVSLVGRPCDLSGDDFVDGEDVAMFGEMWRTEKSPVSADLDQDGLVDFRDLSILAECWLSEE